MFKWDPANGDQTMQMYGNFFTFFGLVIYYNDPFFVLHSAKLIGLSPFLKARFTSGSTTKKPWKLGVTPLKIKMVNVSLKNHPVINRKII